MWSKNKRKNYTQTNKTHIDYEQNEENVQKKSSTIV